DRIAPAALDEVRVRGERPDAHALRLALAKAHAVAAENPGAIVIGADTVVACGRSILPKTEDEATARRCLELLSGRRHRVVGGLALVGPDRRELTRLVTSVVAFKRLEEAEIRDYLASGEWHGEASGYAAQRRAAARTRCR